MNEQDRPLSFRQLCNEIRLLARFGDNAVFRRAYSLVALFAHREHLAAQGESPKSTAALRPPCDQPNGPWQPRPTRETGERPLTLARVVHESQEDAARRSVFLDPEEAVIAGLADFFAGRIRVLEFRNPNKKYDLASLEQKAIAFLRGRIPVVSVNLAVVDNVDEVVFTLRHIANSLESGVMQSRAQNFIRSYTGDTVTFQRAQCTFQGTEHFGSRWTNNGRVLQYHYRDRFRCLPNDYCCENEAYTEYRNDRWETVWQDSGDSGSQPPTPPPDFETSPWNNQLPVFTDSTIGTLTSDYGWRNIGGTTDFHPGLDIGATAGSNVQSNISGEVVWINSTGSASNPEARGVIVRDANNVTHTFWHVNPSATLEVGDQVNTGDRLGTVHDWARPHLHYAEHAPPNGDWQQRNDTNSRNPLP